MLKAHIRYMDKIYTVTINFEYSFNTIGFFTDLKLAEEIKVKWEGFFEFYNEKLFNFNRHDGDFESDEDEDEYYRLQIIYEEITTYLDVKIEEFPLNTDIFVKQTSKRSKGMKELIQQFERDYKIDKLI